MSAISEISTVVDQVGLSERRAAIAVPVRSRWFWLVREIWWRAGWMSTWCTSLNIWTLWYVR